MKKLFLFIIVVQFIDIGKVYGADRKMLTGIDDISLYLAADISGELLPPKDVAQKISGHLHDMVKIFPEASNFFKRTSMHKNCISLYLSKSGMKKLKATSSKAIYDINKKLKISDVEHFDEDYSDLKVTTISFDGIYNTRKLVALYENIEGAHSVLNCFLIGSDWQYHIKSNSSLSEYVVVVGWGDCPSGCINYRKWTFKLERGLVFLDNIEGDPLPKKRAWN